MGTVKLADITELENTLTDIADAIREKNHSSELIPIENLADTINETILDSSDVLQHDFKEKPFIFYGTYLYPYGLYKSNFTSIYAPNLKQFSSNGEAGGGDGMYVMASCVNCKTIDLPVFGGYNSGGYQFNGCTSLEKVNIPTCVSTGQRMFRGCTKLKYCVLNKYNRPGATMNQYGFQGDISLEGIDLTRNTKINSNEFNGCSKLNTLILRGSTTIALGALNNFTGTPFAAGGAGGTLYVPANKINDYKTATNWITLFGDDRTTDYTNNIITSIEGSIYETQYVDNTLLPQYILTEYTRSDGKNLDNSGSYGSNVQYLSTDFIMKDGEDRWEFLCNETYNSNFFKVQEFNGSEFVGMGTMYDGDIRTYNGVSYKATEIYLPNGGDRFRFCAYPKSTAEIGAYLFKATNWNKPLPESTEE